MERSDVLVSMREDHGFHVRYRMEASCLELALEGERLCKSGDCQAGVSFFEAAVQVGTEDLKTLSAIYSQLGNAYFYLHEYPKALEYHHHDLTLARTIGDRLGEAKASGNLGNTLKVLGNFDEAIVCCEKHLDISREIGDKIGEARALYNLGNVYHSKGKHIGCSGANDPGEFPEEVKTALQQAADYYDEPLDNANDLANLVEEKLVKHYQTDVINQNKGKTQSQMLILDRGFDPVSTVLHELTFQAMAYDLLPIENDIYKYKTEGSQGQEKEEHLEEDDELWKQIRHMHIADVAVKIPKLVKEIASTKKATEGKPSLSHLSALMKKMPHFRKQISKQVLHLNLAEDCLKKFHSGISKLCKVEQDLALGTDENGQTVKDSMRILLPILISKNIDNYDKIRAILLDIFHGNGITQEKLDKVIQHCHIENDGDVLRNWEYLGVPILSKSASQPHKSTRRDRSETEAESYQLSRWIPVIKDVMEDSIENKLDGKEWPYCSECPAAWNGSGAVSARQKHKPNDFEDRKTGSKLIIFIIGGMTYSEMRCAYEVAQAHPHCNVIIGSTHVLTPKAIMDDVKALKKPLGPKDTISLVNESNC